MDIRTMGDSGPAIPFLNYNTAGRVVMQRTHDGQKPVIKDPEESIIDTGYSVLMNDFTFDVVIENDSIFIKAVKKYNNRDDIWSNDEWSSVVIFCHDTVLNELVHYEVPRYRILGNKMGMEYHIDEAYIESLTMRDMMYEGTRLAWSNNSSGNAYKTGRNLNVFTGSLPETGEDCTLISRSAIDAFAIKLYDTYEVSYSKTSILADTHGKGDLFKAFPDIGDYIAPSEILFNRIDLDLKALKNEDYSIINNAMLYTNKGLRSRRPHFSNPTLLSYGGTVVDIDVFYNSNSGENLESDTTSQQLAKYLLMLRTYHSDILDVYNYYRKNYIHGSVSADTNNLIESSMVYLEVPIKGKVPNISRVRKKSKLDMYTVQITVESDLKVNNGFKFTDRYGGRFYNI